MTLSWIVAVDLGIIFARYFRSLKFYIYLHFLCFFFIFSNNMIINLLLLLKNGLMTLIDNPSNYGLRVHVLIGIVCLAFVGY